MKQVYLIGYMGSGKSTIGPLLAVELGMSFIDLDAIIEKRAGISIPEIFQRYGEDQFRELESSALHSLMDDDNIVVATGGGAPCFNENLVAMKECGIVIYLKVPVGILTERITLDKANVRPLAGQLKADDLHQHIEEHLRKRSKYYEQANVIQDASLPADQIVNNLADMLK